MKSRSNEEAMVSAHIKTVARLREARELLQIAEFSQRAGMTSMEVAAAVQEHRLFLLTLGDEALIPAFFLSDRFDREQLESISTILADLSAVSKWLFFTTPRGSLAMPGNLLNGLLVTDGEPRTPLQALEDGEFEAVKRCAESVASR